MTCHACEAPLYRNLPEHDPAESIEPVCIECGAYNGISPVVFAHVHRLFDSLDPHTAANVEPHVRADALTADLSESERLALIATIRSFDPDSLN